MLCVTSSTPPGDMVSVGRRLSAPFGTTQLHVMALDLQPSLNDCAVVILENPHQMCEFIARKALFLLLLLLGLDGWRVD